MISRLRHIGIAGATIAFACAIAAVPAASAAPGDVSFAGCISGNTEALVAAGKNCLPAPAPAPGGALSAFDEVTSVAVSPDGSDVYAVSETEDAIVALHRDPGSGALAFVNCITGSSAGVPCATAPHASASGAGSGMYHLSDVVVSPDGAQVYAVAPFDDAIATFDRDAGTGALSFDSCLTADTSAGTSTGGSCAEVPNSGTGDDTGLEGLRFVAISPDGANVYGGAPLDAALAAFDRDAGTGALSFNDCVTGERGALSVEGGNCHHSVPGVEPLGERTALTDVHSVAVSPLGNYVYTTSEDEAALVAFPRVAGGAVIFGSCVTGSIGAVGTTGGCATTPYTASLGVTSGLGRLYDVAASPDGADIYAVSQSDDAISTFRHDPGTGALAFVGCLTGNNTSSTLIGRNCAPLPGGTPSGGGSGLDSTTSLAIAPDGNRIYTTASFDDALASFDRDPATGALSFAGCLAGNTLAVNCTPIANAAAEGTASGMGGTATVAVSPGGGELYSTARADDAVAWFGVEPSASGGGEEGGGGSSGAGAGDSGPAADTTAPKLWAVRIAPRAFAVGRRGRGKKARSAARDSGRRRAKRARRGATVRFKLSEAARVVVRVQRGLPGMRRTVRGKRRCVKPTRALRRRHAKRCLRFRNLRPTLVRSGRRGQNRFRFSGRLGRRALRPGPYRMLLRATDGAGNVSRSRRSGFRIVRASRR